MGMMDKLRNFMGMPEDDEEYFYDDEPETDDVMDYVSMRRKKEK